MSRIEITDGQPIYWFDGKTPKRKRKGKNGVPITEKVPAPPWRYMIKPSGSIIPLSLTGAAADRNPNGAAAVNRRTKKLAAGFLWADECPIATGYMPRELKRKDDKPCAGYLNEDGRPIQGPADQVCVHAQRIIEARAAAHGAEAADWNERFKRDEHRVLEALLRREERELEREESAPRKGKAE
jgi:hypothetical protein